MKTGTKSKTTDGLLKAAILLCVAFTLVRAGEFVYGHIPPYSEGTCVVISGKPGLMLRIDQNHILGGYSDATIELIFGLTQKGPISFQELREVPFVKVPCEKGE